MADNNATKSSKQPRSNNSRKKRLRSTLPSPKLPESKLITDHLQIKVITDNISNRLSTSPSQHQQNEIKEQSHPITPSTPVPLNLSRFKNYVSSGTDFTTPSTTHRNSFPDTQDNTKQHCEITEFDMNVDFILSEYTTNPQHSQSNYTHNNNNSNSNNSNNSNNGNSNGNSRQSGNNNNSGRWNNGDDGDDEKKRNNDNDFQDSNDDDEMEEEEEENENKSDENDSNSESNLNISAATFVPLAQQSKSAKSSLITINEHGILYSMSKSAPMMSKQFCTNLRHIYSYDPHKIFRGTGNIRILKNFTGNVIPNMIRECIFDIYDFMDKYTAINTYNGYDCEFGNVRILNYGFHGFSGEILYCVADKVNGLNHRNYGYFMRDKLYTKQEIFDDHELSMHCIKENELPEFSKVWPDFKTCAALFSDPVFLCEKVIFKTKWHKIQIFNSVNKNKDFNKRRLTYAITNEEFINVIQQAVHCNNIHDGLIPIVMFYSNKYHIEYVQIVKLRDNTNIGVSYVCENNVDLRITGIHLNKDNILNQHQLVSPNHDCHCLDHFQSEIDDLHIGNPDDNKNRINALRSRNKQLSNEKKTLNIQLEAALNKIQQLERENYMLTPINISSSSPITTQPTFSTISMYTPQYTFGSNYSNTPSGINNNDNGLIGNYNQVESPLSTFPTCNSNNTMKKPT